MQTNKDLKQLQKDIKKAKQECKEELRERGMFENFGEKQHRKLKDKWEFKSCAISYSTICKELELFYNWAGDYNGEELI
jgi:hypothetical protein